MKKLSDSEAFHMVVPLTGPAYVLSPEGAQYMLPYSIETLSQDDWEDLGEPINRPPRLVAVPPPEKDFIRVERRLMLDILRTHREVVNGDPDSLANLLQAEDRVKAGAPTLSYGDRGGIV